MEERIAISIPVNQLIKLINISSYNPCDWPETIANTIKHCLVEGSAHFHINSQHLSANRVNDSEEFDKSVSNSVEEVLNQQPKLSSTMSREAMGYQWKKLFLPHGTQIRMRYKEKYFYAAVENDEMIYQGKSATPGSFVKQIAGSMRNAWHDLWIKRPTDEEWKVANEYRSRENRRK